MKFNSNLTLIYDVYIVTMKHRHLYTVDTCIIHAHIPTEEEEEKKMLYNAARLHACMHVCMYVCCKSQLLLRFSKANVIKHIFFLRITFFIYFLWFSLVFFFFVELKKKQKKNKKNTNVKEEKENNKKFQFISW